MMRFENEGRLLIQPAFVILVGFLEETEVSRFVTFFHI